MSQLRPLVKMLERSQDEALQVASGQLPGIGWWITHIMLLPMDYETSQASQGTYFVSSLEETVMEYIGRLLACCPRLEVFLDCAPYGSDTPSAVHCVLSLLSASSTLSGTNSSRLRSLEWKYSGPLESDLRANPHITKDLRSLRCCTIYSSDPDPSLRNLNSEFSKELNSHRLSFANLTSLDIWISPKNYAYIHLVAESDLPSLTHFTLRSPPSTGILLKSKAYAALKSFFLMHGSKPHSLELRVWPGDVPSPQLPLSVGVPHVINVPEILSQCPHLTDLVLSARWFASHQPPLDESDGDENTSPFSIPLHTCLERIGLLDTQPPTPCFLHTASEMPCLSCNRRPLVNIPRRGDFGFQRAGAEVTGTTGLMSHRHCTIDRHLRMILYGFKPINLVTKHEQMIVRYHQLSSSSNSSEKRFPRLKSIHLLDSQPDMFELNGRCSSSWRTCHHCMSHVETGFWNAWAARCEERGIALLDRHEKGVLRYPSRSERLEDVMDRYRRFDLDEELRNSVVEFEYRNSTMSDIPGLLLENTVNWFSELRGMLGMICE